MGEAGLKISKFYFENLCQNININQKIQGYKYYENLSNIIKLN